MRCILTHNKSKTRAVHITSLKIRTIEKKKLKNRDLKNLKHAKKIIIESDQNIRKQRPLPYLSKSRTLFVFNASEPQIRWLDSNLCCHKNSWYLSNDKRRRLQTNPLSMKLLHLHCPFPLSNSARNWWI